MVGQNGRTGQGGALGLGRPDPAPVYPNLSRPHVGPSRVHRPRLTAMLDAGARRRVTLVCAGPGWGKTTLVSAWAATRPSPLAWLTLDAHDNDPRVFASHVIAALRAATAATGPAVDALQTAGVGHVRSLGRVLNWLRAPTALVLDDFDAIDNRRLTRELDELLRAPRSPLRIVISTRSEPTVPLYRLRAAGELSEIRAADLAFTDEEAAGLLAVRGVTLPSEDVGTLVRRTDGWAAGLQLAADYLTSPAGGTVADFAGDVRPVDDYLVGEVLARQPPQRRRFLLHTSICEHLSGGLADAVTGERTGQRTLEELEHVNQFIVRLDSRPTWFRYHHLIRDVLRHHLLVESPEIVPELHRRAAGWYARHGFDLEALAHAVHAQDWPYVGRLVVEAAPIILSHDRGRLVGVLEQIPADRFTDTASLTVCEALLLFNASDYAAIRDRIGRAQRMLSDRPDPDEPAVQVAIRALRTAADRADGDLEAVLGDATTQLTELAHVPLGRLTGTLRYRAVALNNKGVALLCTGRPEAAQQCLAMGSAAARAAGVELVEINALGYHAVLEAMAGSVRESERLARAALDQAQRGGWTNALQAVPAHHATALVELEHGRPARAERAVRHAARAHRSDPEAAQWKISLGIGARLAMAQDRLPNAVAFLDEARRNRFPRARMPVIDRWLRTVESEADLLAGRPDRVVQRYAAGVDAGTLSLPERNLLTRAALAGRDLGRAEALLTGTGSVMAETTATVEARILAALVHEATGRGFEATETLTKAITLAAAESIRRPFISLAGGRLGPLLQRQQLLNGEHASFVADLLRLSGAPGRTAAAPAGGAALSERETEVLRYLPTMLTAAEIGEELGVSVNTIKAHMRAIYRKLGTPRRRQAVSRAREQGLV